MEKVWMRRILRTTYWDWYNSVARFSGEDHCPNTNGSDAVGLEQSKYRVVTE
jgi:hypothetical protein